LYAPSLVFELLEEEYWWEVEHLGLAEVRAEAADVTQHLAQHLMMLYWYGQLTSLATGTLLDAFYLRAPDAVRSQAHRWLGGLLANKDTTLESGPLGRLQALWVARVATAKDASDSKPFVGELAAFSGWFGSRQFDDEWVLQRFRETLAVTSLIDSAHGVMTRLARVARIDPLGALECLDRISVGDRRGWVIRTAGPQLHEILSIADSSGELIAAESAAVKSRLAYRGFGDLIT
jgi:hypothetical protein